MVEIKQLTKLESFTVRFFALDGKEVTVIGSVEAIEALASRLDGAAMEESGPAASEREAGRARTP